MEILLLTQPKTINQKNYCLGEQIKSLLLSKRPKFTDVTFFFGLVKENAYEKISDSLKTFILNGGNVTFYLSQDKKGNMKKVINSLLELGCNVHLFKGTDKDFVSDFQYKLAIFKSPKKAISLFTSGNFSISGLFEGYNTVTQFTYNLPEDNNEFNEFSSSLLTNISSNLFCEVTRSNLEDTFLTDKAIPSIEEFTHKDIESVAPIITSLDDIGIDIEIDKNVDFLVASDPIEKEKKEPSKIKEQPSKVFPSPIDDIEFKETKYYIEDDAIDIENMLFTSSANSKVKNTNLSIDNMIEDTLPESKIIAKNTNLSKTSIFMFQLPKITKKGSSMGEIKIPTYLRDLIPTFWDWPKEYSLDKERNEKSRKCTFKIVDTTDANVVLTDDNVKLFQKEGENSFIILSNKLIELDLQENDILRLIKTASPMGSYFTCEVIRQNASEYPIWEQFCTNYLKGSKRKYGMM